MADRYDNDRSDAESDEDGQSVFDLFEPPPPTDPSSFGKIPVIKDDEIDLTDGASDVERKAAADAEAAGLQHWTAPPTGQVPAVLSEKDPKSGLWGDVAGPSWHGDDPTWSGPDLADVFADADAIRLDEYADDEDDEEEDDDFGRVAPPPAQSRPQHRASATPTPAPTTPPPVNPVATPEPPLAAAPERREPPIRDWPTSGDHVDNGHSEVAATAAASAPRAVPRPRPDSPPDLASAPDPHPGADTERPTWPTSPDLPPKRDLDAPTPERSRTEPQSRTRPDPRGLSNGEPPKPSLLSSQEITAPGLADGRSDAPAFPRDVPSPASAPPKRASLFDDDRSVPSIDDIEFDDSKPSSGRRVQHRQATRPVERPQLDNDYPDDEYEFGAEDSDGFDGFEERPARSRAGRNLPMAVGVGAAMLGILVGAMWLGPEMTLLLVVVLALVGVVELYNAMRLAGLRPANLLGIVGTAAAPAAAFYRGDAGMPLIVGLTVVFGALWYLVGADSERPVLNLSLTMMGIFWVGGLASFAGLMLREDGGLDLLLAAIIITVVSDTMAYIGGRAYGRRPFHPASPNKTWEGTITGFLGAVFAGFAIGAVGLGDLWEGNFLAAVALGAVVGVLAPIGDLTESVVKRDLGVKDMGQLLPGHGGVLDRVDALLFALPGAYYLALVAGLI